MDAADQNHLQLDILAVALDRNGKLLAGLTQRLDLRPSATGLERLRKNGLAYSGAIQVSDPTAKVRFIVTDDLRGRIGTVCASLETEPYSAARVAE